MIPMQRGATEQRGGLEAAPAPAAARPPLELPDLAIDDIVTDRVAPFDGLGQIVSQTVRFSDGSIYHRKIGLPDIRLQRTEYPVTYTTALATTMVGLNRMIYDRLLRKGMPVMLVSPQEVGRKDLRHILEVDSLEHDVAAHQLMLGDQDDDYGSMIDGSTILLTGYSRGGNVGFGIHSTARNFDRRVAYFDFADPCLEHGVNAESIDGVIDQVADGARDLIHNLGFFGLVETFVGSPKKIASDVAVGASLFRGRGTGHMADGIPEDSVGRLSFFSGNRLNHRDDWKRKFAAHPFVRIFDYDGTHTRGTNLEYWDGAVERLSFAASCLLEHVDLKSADWSSLGSAA